MPGGDGGFQQVQRAGDVHIDKSLPGKSGDVRLVERAGMDDGLNAMAADHRVDKGAIGHSADLLSVWSRRNIKARDLMALCCQHRGEVAAEPAGGAGQEDAHRSLTRPQCSRFVPRAIRQFL